MNSSFKLVTVLGIPVKINYSWFIIFSLVVYSLASGYFPIVAPGFIVMVYWIMAVIAGLLLFLCLILHELSHSYIAEINHLPVSGITLFVFGGVAHMEKEPDNPGIEFKMAAAGPIMSVLLGSFFLLLSYASRQFDASRVIYSISDYLVFLNFAIAAFNLIPGFPLDGGRIFRAVYWHFSKDLRRATRVASNLGKTFAYFMIALGFIGLVTGNLISGVWFIFLGFFLLEAAIISYRQMEMRFWSYS